jgi:hypothetical protein
MMVQRWKCGLARLRELFAKHANHKTVKRQRAHLVVEGLEDRITPAPITWTGGAGNSDWDTAGNWSTATVPGASDDVTFDNTSVGNCIVNTANGASVQSLAIYGGAGGYAGTLVINTSLTMTAGFTCAGGTISGNGNLTLQGTDSWTGGTMSGTGTTIVAAGASLTLGGTTDRILDQRSFTINGGGLVTLTAGRLVAQNGSVITNSGTFSLQGNNLVIADGSVGNTPSFINDALFTKTQSQNDTAQIGVPFTNANGTVRVETGVLNFAAAFAQWDMPNSSVDIRAAGGGEIQGVDMTFAGGTLVGDGTLRVTGPGGGTLSWWATTMDGSGQVIVSPATTMLLEAAFTDRGFNLRNNGTVRWIAGNISLDNQATIFNQPLSLFQVESHAILNGTAGTVFNNAGTFRKIQAPLQQVGITHMQIAFNSVTQTGQPNSLVDVQFGVLQLLRSGYFLGNVNAAAQGVVEFGNFAQVYTMLDGTQLSGAGVIRITNAGTLALADNATVTSSGVFQIGGAAFPVFNPNGFLTGNGMERLLTLVC